VRRSALALTFAVVVSLTRSRCWRAGCPGRSSRPATRCRNRRSG